MTQTSELQSPAVQSVVWFYLLVSAWQKNDFAKAAEALKRLGEYGITVKLPRMRSNKIEVSRNSEVGKIKELERRLEIVEESVRRLSRTNYWPNG